MSDGRSRQKGFDPLIRDFHRTLAAALTLLVGLAGACAHAEMQLDRSILVFAADAPARQDVEITNTGDEILYLDTEILVVTDPGTEAEARTLQQDPDAAGILVTPARTVLQPGGRQLLRIVLLREPDATDRIYRINVRPVVPPLAADQTAVKVVVAYQLLVIQQPESPDPSLTWSRDGTRITFTNTGNSNVLLYNGRQCETDANDACVDLEGARRLYAGNVWTVDLPFDAPVEFTMGVGQSNVRRRFD